MRTRDGFRTWSLGEPGSDERELIRRETKGQVIRRVELPLGGVGHGLVEPRVDLAELLLHLHDELEVHGPAS